MKRKEREAIGHNEEEEKGSDGKEQKKTTEGHIKSNLISSLYSFLFLFFLFLFLSFSFF